MAGRTALVVRVPEADPVVGRYRLELDPAARLGVPAHVTVLFPFVPTDRLNEPVRAAVRSLFGDVAPFDYRLSDIHWFRDDVVWLAPDPGRRFCELTERAHAAFPEYPPYEGQFDEVIPHLTVGDHACLTAMRQAACDITRELPIQASASSVTLMVQDTASGRWAIEDDFPLAG